MCAVLAGSAHYAPSSVQQPTHRSIEACPATAEVPALQLTGSASATSAGQDVRAAIALQVTLARVVMRSALVDSASPATATGSATWASAAVGVAHAILHQSEAIGPVLLATDVPRTITVHSALFSAQVRASMGLRSVVVTAHASMASAYVPLDSHDWTAANVIVIALDRTALVYALHHRLPTAAAKLRAAVVMGGALTACLGTAAACAISASMALLAISNAS